MLTTKIVAMVVVFLGAMAIMVMFVMVPVIMVMAIAILMVYSGTADRASSLVHTGRD